jgi:glycosyltransferase involved in cell wall biosynthesis
MHSGALKMKTIIIIPAHNEEKTVGNVVDACKRYGKIIVVNDASSDRTAEFAKKAGAIVITHEVNLGLGAALRTGFSSALKMKPDIVITLDADGQHMPGEIPKFISKISEGYDFVLGKRDLAKYPVRKKVGNFILNFFTNLVSHTRLADTESGFRAFRADALEKLDLRAQRYEIAAEIVKQSGKNRLKSANVPITIPVYIKGVGVSDGIKNFIYILRH